METINGLTVERSGNAFIVHAIDHEGVDKVDALNLALHVIEVIKGKIAADSTYSPYVMHRFFVETVSGSLLSQSETKQAIAFIQPRMRFS